MYEDKEKLIVSVVSFEGSFSSGRAKDASQSDKNGVVRVLGMAKDFVAATCVRCADFVLSLFLKNRNSQNFFLGTKNVPRARYGTGEVIANSVLLNSRHSRSPPLDALKNTFFISIYSQSLYGQKKYARTM